MLREKELPKAQRIIDEETDRFMAELEARRPGPSFAAESNRPARSAQSGTRATAGEDRWRRSAGAARNRTLVRAADQQTAAPTLESLREEAGQPTEPVSLIDAMKRLFQLRD